MPDSSEPPAAWHAASVPAVLDAFSVDPHRGLSDDEARKRHDEHGPNELVEQQQRTALQILLEQFQNPLVWLLIGAAIVSIFVGELAEVIAILAIVALNAALGFFQDYRAENALALLRDLSAPTAVVLRNGEWRRLPARELAPGDVYQLEAGARCPADGRLVEAAHLQINEASLTGESMPVEKQIEPLDEDTSLAERSNMVFKGSTVSGGRGVAVVTAVGMRSELGRIAELLEGVEREETPLQRRLSKLGRQLTYGALILIALMVVIGLVRQQPLKLVFLTALSMAVAVIPEGLPAAVTVVLAIGTRRMLKRQALVRRLAAIETLGSVTVICTDKTGTLTMGRMAATDVAIGDQDISLSDLASGGHDAAADGVRSLLAAATLCSDAHQPAASSADVDAAASKADNGEGDAAHQGGEPIGDPTEVAIVEAAADVRIDLQSLHERFPRVEEVSFDSDRKRMSTVHKIAEPGDLETFLPLLSSQGGQPGDARLVCCKGSLESVLSVSDRHWTGSDVAAIDEQASRDWNARHDQLASRGFRVLAVGVDVRAGGDWMRSNEGIEQNLILVGLIGLSDPPRSEAKEAVERCHTAGIRPVMITGDHPLTARHIAGEIGIGPADRVLTGRDLAALDDAGLSKAALETSVYARVTPEDKLKIVDALRQHGEVVAMTGDGVNDAPALRKSSVGVAMGITGTDVAKDAADLVLLDDNFASIVAAVGEGRIILGNILRFLKFLLSTNSGELWVMILAILLGMPLPLLPIQILWINLVTDGFPALGLAFENTDRHAMRRPPRAVDAPLLDREMLIDILWIGLLMGIVSLAAGGSLSPSAEDEARWRTMIFSVLTISQLGNALALRSSTEPLWRLGLWTNPLLLVSVVVTAGLQAAVVYVPFLQRTFGTVPLSLRDAILCPLLGLVVYVAVEGVKLWRNRG
ncbi:MAG: cation-translocating P-type ATPase [Planctomyces sp.]|nr:cation-translocating P-type ATPase [Planctomyces sp.]